MIKLFLYKLSVVFISKHRELNKRSLNFFMNKTQVVYVSSPKHSSDFAISKSN